MTTHVTFKQFVGAIGACAACLERDPLRHLPGRMRVTRAADALVLATSTRTDKVKMAFRIPCDPGDSWVAVVDADGTSRLARALRPLAGAKKNGCAMIDLERGERSLVLAGDGQRIVVPACDPVPDDALPAACETIALLGAGDLLTRLAQAMTFCNPVGYQPIAKGPFVHLAATDGGLAVTTVVATDGHRLFVDGDARDCGKATHVFQVPGDQWKAVAKATDGSFEAGRLVRTSIPRSSDEETRDQPTKYSTRIVLESADRRVELAVDEPETQLPHWAGFVPREMGDPDLSVICSRAALAAAVKSAIGVARLRNSACMLRGRAEQGLLCLCAQTDFDGGIVQREIPAEVQHAPSGYVHLNGRYLLDALAATRTESVRLFQHSAPLDPIRIAEVVPAGAELRARGMVVMPIRGHDPVEADAVEPEVTENSAPAAEPTAPPLAAVPTVAA